MTHVWLRAIAERLAAAWDGAQAQAQTREEAKVQAEADAAEERQRVQAEARRRGFRPWNYSRPAKPSGVSRESLEYLVAIHGEKGAARLLRDALRRREAKR